MTPEISHQLLSLESRDVITRWFRELHARELSARRAKEIIAAARQAREFFSNAATSNFSVRPLLSFYGVASLARAVTLLMQSTKAEEGLTKGHGLQTLNWDGVFYGEVPASLGRIGELKIQTCAGLFMDFANATNNTMTLHVRSSAVDWRMPYELPQILQEVCFQDLLSRLPDANAVDNSIPLRGCRISEMTYRKQQFEAKLDGDCILELWNAYSPLGYTCTGRLPDESYHRQFLTLQCAEEVLEANPPQFSHAYVGKMFGSIPALHMTLPFPNGVRFSQICMAYMVSYILGMLVRYYPTHWISLIQGEKGDALWPTLNRAHHFIETAFPEMVAEYIADVLALRRAAPVTASAVETQSDE